MNEIYEVVHDPVTRKWSCVNELGITVWHDNDEKFIRRFARDPAFRWSIVEDCIRAEQAYKR